MSNQLGNKLPQTSQFWQKRGLLGPILTVVGIHVVLLVILMVFAFDSLDKFFRDGLRDRVDVSLTVEADHLMTLLTEYTYWDAAYKNLIAKLDTKWADEKIGSYMEESLDIDFSLAVKGTGQPSIAFMDGRPVDISLDDLLVAGLSELLTKIRTGDGGQPSPATGFLKLGTDVYLIVVDQFVPEEEGHAPYDGAYLVLAKRMNQAGIGTISNTYRLPDLHFSASVPTRETQYLTLTNPHGDAIMWLSWKSPEPANKLLIRLVPLIAFSLLILIFVTRWFLHADTVRRRQYEEMLHRLAITDPLTDIYNRREFLRLADCEVSRSRRYNDIVSMVMFDVDHFKRINDQYGHPTGDKALRLISDCVRQHLREIDVFGRIGGEEFGVLLPATDIMQTKNVIERLRQSIAEASFEVNKQKVRLTASFGATCLHDNDTLDTLLYRVDELLYKAKNQGRNCCIMSE